MTFKRFFKHMFFLLLFYTLLYYLMAWIESYLTVYYADLSSLDMIGDMLLGSYILLMIPTTGLKFVILFYLAFFLFYFIVCEYFLFKLSFMRNKILLNNYDDKEKYFRDKYRYNTYIDTIKAFKISFLYRLERIE